MPKQLTAQLRSLSQLGCTRVYEALVYQQHEPRMVVLSPRQLRYPCGMRLRARKCVYSYWPLVCRCARIALELTERLPGISRHGRVTGAGIGSLGGLFTCSLGTGISQTQQRGRDYVLHLRVR
jgi:hypothetical protein